MDVDPLLDLGALSKPALLALAITVVCRALKAAPFFKDWLIPWAALLMGAFFYPLITETFTSSAVLTGVVVGGVTVGLYSTAKQTLARSEESKLVQVVFGKSSPESERPERRIIS